MKSTMVCHGTAAKSGEPCTRPARNLSRYCGLCEPKERERKSAAASAQWKGERLLRENEAAWKLIAAHQLRWCRARLFHALASAHEQGVLIDVLGELFDDSVIGDAADGGALAIVLGARLRQWAPDES